MTDYENVFVFLLTIILKNRVQISNDARFLFCGLVHWLGLTSNLNYAVSYCGRSGTHPERYSKNTSSQFCSTTEGMVPPLWYPRGIIWMETWRTLQP